MSRKKQHWRDLTARSASERRAMPTHCFLEPKERKYPVCRKGSSKIDCQGLDAAFRRARLQKNDNVMRKASQKMRKMRCKSNNNKNSNKKWEALPPTKRHGDYKFEHIVQIHKRPQTVTQKNTRTSKQKVTRRQTGNRGALGNRKSSGSRKPSGRRRRSRTRKASRSRPMSRNSRNRNRRYVDIWVLHPRRKHVNKT